MDFLRDLNRLNMSLPMVHWTIQKTIMHFRLDSLHIFTLIKATCLKKTGINRCFELYHQKFGDRLKWSFFKDPNKPDRYSENVLKRYQKKIIDSDGDHVDCWCASEEGFEYASDYCVQMLSSADWFEYVHFPVTYFFFICQYRN
jgi:hypothetical protein